MKGAHAEVLFRAGSQRLLRSMGTDWVSLTTLADRLSISKPSVLRTVAPLIDSGFVEARETTTATGRHKEYRSLPFSIRWDHRAGTDLFWATTGSLPREDDLLHQVPPGEFRDDLREALAAIRGVPSRGDLRLVVLFGSVARGEGTWKSDLDLLVLLTGDVARDEIRDALADPSRSFRHAVRPVFSTPSAFRAENGDGLLREIYESGIVILGDPHGDHDLWMRLDRYRNFSTSRSATSKPPS